MIFLKKQTKRINRSLIETTAYQKPAINQHLLFISEYLEAVASVVFCKTDAHLNFAKFTGKHLYGSLFLIKLQASIFNFPVNFSKLHRIFFYRTPLTLRKKYLHSELFWSVFSHIRTEYGEIRRISPYSVRIRENTDQDNSE